jgi:hypothetical protein
MLFKPTPLLLPMAYFRNPPAEGEAFAITCIVMNVEVEGELCGIMGTDRFSLRAFVFLASVGISSGAKTRFRHMTEFRC